MKFVIITTRTHSGGNIVLRELCRLLIKKGHSAKIIAGYTLDDLYHPTNFPALLTKRLLGFIRTWFKRVLILLGKKEDLFANQKCPHKILPIVDKDTIVVYPEGVFGNPLKAKKIVRLFLYYNRHPNNPKAYGEDELVFTFRPIFNDYKINPTCRLFKLNHFDSTLYKQFNFRERSGNCYIIRKGKNRSDLPKEFDGPIIDNLSEKEKVSVLNKCKYCYDYDTQTFYSSIACVCGCIPIIVMEPGKTKKDYLGAGDVDYGRAYGDSPEEIERAIKTRDIRLKTLDYTEENERNISYFLKEVTEYFKEK